jgi:hypothetical protein
MLSAGTDEIKMFDRDPGEKDACVRKFRSEDGKRYSENSETKATKGRPPYSDGRLLEDTCLLERAARELELPSEHPVRYPVPVRIKQKDGISVNQVVDQIECC